MTISISANTIAIVVRVGVVVASAGRNPQFPFNLNVYKGFLEILALFKILNLTDSLLRINLIILIRL